MGGTDLLTLAKEQAGQFLDADESVVAIFQASPRGTGVSQSGGGAAVGAIGDMWKGKSQKGAHGAGLQLASKMAVALTERRVVVLSGKTSAMSGKINEITGLVSSVPVNEVDSIQVKRLLAGKTVKMSVNGGEVKLEVPPGNDPKGFAELLEKAKTAG